jgi:xanthine dehydrogenase accessory factor
MKNIYLQILELQSKKSPLVLATVTSAHGSTPQKPGSSALFNGDGLITGTVGGGIVEGSVQKLVKESIRSKKSSHINFNLANNIADVELAICGGEIKVLIDPNLNNYSSVFEKVKRSLQERAPGVLITMVTNYTDENVLINRYWMDSEDKPEIPVKFMEKIEPVVNSLIKEADPTDFREMELTIPGEEPSSIFFLEPVFPLPKLIIAGAGHIGRALSHLGNMLGFEVTVIDDRADYANSFNLPDASHIIVGSIGEVIKNIEKGEDTYIVIVTRGHKDDAEALKPCIGAGLAYTGMIGSRKKIAEMRKHFIDNGWATDSQWDTIYAPVGIEIKSQTVEEIAVSIAAQLVLVKNRRKSEDRRPKTEVGSPKSEIRNPKSEIRNPKSEIRNPKSEIRNPK